MKIRYILATVATVLVLSACGGGGSGGGNDPPPVDGIVRTGFAIGPITTFGSVVVNGVRYSTTSAVITVDDSPGIQDDLRVGQVVLVRGSINDNLTTGTANEIRFDDNVEGPIESIDLLTGVLVVLGQTVHTDSQTSFDDNIQPASLAGLIVGDIVEVSGLVMGDGSIAATRIEKKAAGALFEVHGIVSNLDSVNFRFSLNSLIIDYSGATLDNFPGGQISVGNPVEAKGSAFDGDGRLIATRVEFEGPATGNANDHVEIEGFITRFASAQDFDVSGLRVTTSSSTVFTGGAAADLGLNIKVEVEGSLNASNTLVATKVDIRRAAAVRATALVDSVNAAGNSLVMLGITVNIDALTRLEDKSNAEVSPLTINSLNTGDYLEVRGAEQPAGSGRILASLLERDDFDTETILQGFVTTASAPSFTILGVTITTNGSTQFRDTDDSIISSAEFFSRAAAGTLVKAKGTETSAAAITADEVELEL
jgi:fructose-specific phosphotransferase system component IIB